MRAAAERPGGRAPGAWSLVALVAAGGALATALWALAGAPELPDPGRLRRSLQGSELSDAELLAAAAWLCWLLLGYLALAVSLRLSALAAARASGGAAWARSGLRLSALVTIPAVRRVVDSGFGGALLAASWLPLPEAAAEPAPPPPIAAAFQAPSAATAAAAAEQQPAASGTGEGPALLYTVAPGDDLWGIARRCYGDGTRFVEIFEANRDRVMDPGERFTDPREVQPGWTLSLPGPVSGVIPGEESLGYRVRAGDHLWGIAERWLGDGFRWVEIWERNRGRDMGEGRRFTDPNVLAPGWVLELPLPEPALAPAAHSAPAGGPAAFLPGAFPGPPGAAPAEAGAEAGAGVAAEWPRLPHTALWSAAGVAVLGGAALFVRRRSGPGSGGPGPDAGGDAGRVALAAGALQEAFGEAGFGASRPLLLREGRRGIAVTVACPAGDAGALAALRHGLALRLGCELAAAARAPDRVELTISRAGRFPGLLGPGPGVRAALAVPVGAAADEVVYLNLEAAGSVTVTGSDGEQRALLRSWLRTLSTLRAPDELSLRTDVGAARLLDGEEAALPHLLGSPGSEPAKLADELEEIIASREGSPVRPLVAIFALDRAGADLPGAAMREGPEAGVYVIRCLPPGTPEEGLPPAGAAVSFGGAGGEDGDAPPAGGLTLRLGRERPLLLERVLVRRDESPRWRESAELAGALSPVPECPSGERANPRRAEADGVILTGVDADPPGGDLEAVGRSPGPALPGADADPPDAEAGPVPPPLGPVLPPANADPPAGESVSVPSSPGPALPYTDADSPVGESVAVPTSPGPAPGPWTAHDTGAPGRGEGPAFRESDADPGERERGGPEPAAGTASLRRQGALLTHDDLDAAGGVAAATGSPLFTIRCLGCFDLRLGDTPITAWPREKSRELLALLATYGGAPVLRETIAEALWPDHPADASLRHMVQNAVAGLRSAVRSAASDDVLQPVATVLQRYQLQAGLFRIDLDDFDATLRRAGELTGEASLGEYERAAALYGGDLLENEYFPWADDYRRDYRRRLLDGAARAAVVAERLGDGRRAAHFYRVIMEREPTDEAAACGQMRQFAAAGQVQGARRVYRALAAALQEELDDPRARPSPGTTALLDDLIAGEGGRQA